MSKRKYTHIKAIEMQIVSMREAGKTRQEIADELGLEKEQIKNWIARYNRRKTSLLQGLPTKPKGRPQTAVNNRGRLCPNDSTITDGEQHSQQNRNQKRKKYKN